MATAAPVISALDKIGAHLVCSICTDRYKTPKVLDCLHTFCEDCLVKLHDSTYWGAPKIACPECRQEIDLPESGVRGLRTNFYLVGLIAEWELQEKVLCSAEIKLLCQLCDKGNEAKDHCLDCDMNICKDCCVPHKKVPALKTHTIASFDDIRQGKVSVTKQPDEYKCSKHEQAGKQFYCKTCKILICQGCTVVDHPPTKHDVTDIGTVSKAYRESLKQGLATLGRDVEGLELAVQHTTEAKKKFKVNTERARKGVQDRTTEIIVTLRAEEKRLLDEIAKQERQQNKRIEGYERTLGDLIQRKRHSLETGMEVASKASDSDFLSLHPVISEDVTKLTSQHNPQYLHKLWYLRFTESPTAGGIDLGKVEQEGDTWELKHSWGKQGSGKGEFESARGIAAVADPDEIAVTDWKNNRVVICNSQGHTKHTIPIVSKDIIAVSNQWVCANPDKILVYRRWKTTPALEFGTLLNKEIGKTEVQLNSVTVMPNGNILAGDVKRKVLTVHDPMKGTALQSLTVKIRPDYLDVLSNGWIVMSDWEDGVAEIVEVSHGKAVTVSQICPRIKGEPVERCTGVCTSSPGIYLAVSTTFIKTGHIHHYNCTGQFVSCVVKGLYSPRGITFTPDGQQLAVADWQSVKLYHKVGFQHGILHKTASHLLAACKRPSYTNKR